MQFPRILRTLLVIGAALAIPALALAAEDPAHAAEGGHGDGQAASNPMAFRLVPFVSTLIAFGIVFFILAKYVWPIILKALADRENKIRREIEDAEAARKQANAALQEYEKALAEARTEASKIVEQAKSDQQKLAAELRAKTEAEIGSLKDAAARDIEAAKRAAITEIYGEMANTASAIAGKILEREIRPEDQESLVEQSLGQLQGVGAS